MTIHVRCSSAARGSQPPFEQRRTLRHGAPGCWQAARHDIWARGDAANHGVLGGAARTPPSNRWLRRRTARSVSMRQTLDGYSRKVVRLHPWPVKTRFRDVSEQILAPSHSQQSLGRMPSGAERSTPVYASTGSLCSAIRQLLAVLLQHCRVAAALSYAITSESSHDGVSR